MDTRSLWRSGESTTGSALLAAILAVSVVFYLSRKTKKREEYPLPPGPRGLPLLGSLPFLGSDLHISFAKLSDAYGPVLSLRLGAKLCFVLSSPDAAKEALKDNDVVFANHDVPAAVLAFPYWGKDMVFAPYGPHWRMIRKLTARELLSPATINGLYGLRRTEVRKMVEEIRGKTGQTVNLQELVSATAMNMMMAMLWGGSVVDSSVKEEFQLKLHEMVELMGSPNISDFYPAIAWLDLQGLARRMRKVAVCFDRIFEPIIKNRLRLTVEKKNARDYLQVLLDLVQNPNSEAPMTVDCVKALLLNMVSGGTDTTSTVVEWAMAELLRAPEKMERAKEEIAAVVGGGDAFEEGHLPSLAYLEAVVKETLRLHPVVPLLVPHRPSSSCTVCGYRIPEGTKVFINAWAIQRNARIWEEASEFKPERFLAGGGGDFSGNKFGYLPFGAGRRICVGVPLGERMVMFVLASLIHSADWVLPEGSVAALDMKEKFGIVMRKEKALVAVPFPL